MRDEQDEILKLERDLVAFRKGKTSTSLSHGGAEPKISDHGLAAEGEDVFV